MGFKEFFDSRHPELNGRWGVTGEFLSDALSRWLDDATDYINEMRPLKYDINQTGDTDDDV